MSLLSLSIFLIFLCFSELASKQHEQDSIKVSLYYESLCPGSREFITDELYPGYLKIKKALVLDLVPFGKATQHKVKRKWQFKCQHGPEECLGNKLQACALAQPASRDSKFGFIFCMMNSTDPSSFINGKNCAKSYDFEWREIKECVVGKKGNKLLAHYGERTRSLTPELEHIPHILFNGIYNATVEESARNNFSKTVCSLLKVKPRICVFV